MLRSYIANTLVMWGLKLMREGEPGRLEIASGVMKNTLYSLAKNKRERAARQGS